MGGAENKAARMARTCSPAKVSPEINVTSKVHGSSLEMAMKQQSAKHANLDLLCQELVKASALNDEDIEAIADSGRLFASVRARIISDRAARPDTGEKFSLAHRLLLASSAAIVIAAGVFGAWVMMARKNQDVNLAKGNIPRASDSLAVNVTPQISQNIPEDLKARQIDEIDLQPRFERAVYRPDARRPVHRPQPRVDEKPMEFYALADLHPSEDAAQNGRIIRVDLPKASLVALGVNIPLDGDKQVFKTDLLVGPDGVPRALRLVE